jgi:hypothetical protein
VVIDVLLLRLPSLRGPVQLPAPPAPLRGKTELGYSRVVGGVRGRGPPVSVCP